MVAIIEVIECKKSLLKRNCEKTFRIYDFVPDVCKREKAGTPRQTEKKCAFLWLKMRFFKLLQNCHNPLSVKASRQICSKNKVTFA
jgi:hypothetical protein